MSIFFFTFANVKLVLRKKKARCRFFLLLFVFFIVSSERKLCRKKKKPCVNKKKTTPMRIIRLKLVAFGQNPVLSLPYDTKVIVVVRILTRVSFDTLSNLVQGLVA